MIDSLQELRKMIFTAILLFCVVLAKGENGIPGYPLYERMGISHVGRAAFVRTQPAARVVVQGAKGGLVHGGRVVANGVKGVAVAGHHGGFGAVSGAGWGAGAGKQQIVDPASKHVGVVSSGAGFGISGPAKKVHGVVSTGGAGWATGGGHKQVVYPARNKAVGVISKGGAGWGSAGARLVSTGGFGGASGHKKIVGAGVIRSGGGRWGLSSGNNALYPAPQKKVVASAVYPAPQKKVIARPVYPAPQKKVVASAIYPAQQKKVVVSAGGSYPHGNVQAVGGHGYFPDVAPGLQGYGKGVYYKQVANVGPMAVSCPYGWQYYHGSCYYFSRDRLSWWEAYAKCTFMGGYLAMVNYAHENSYLKLMSKKMKFEDGAWFGLNDILFPKTHTWYWGFGKKGCKWFDWFGKGPKYRGADNNCVCFQEDYHYQWGVNSCQTKMYYICELNPKMPCKCGY